MGFLDRFVKRAKAPIPGECSEVVDVPKETQLQLEEAMALEKEGKLDAALQCYETVLNLQPNLARAHFNRGNILLDRGDATNALVSYAKALALKPDSAASHYNIGSAHLRLGHSDAGIAACRRAIELKPDFVDAYVTLGVALGELGQHDDAIACYRSALEIKPASAEAYVNLGTTLSILGRTDDAIRSFRSALAISPNFSVAHSNLLLVQNFVIDYSERKRLNDAMRYGELAAKRARVSTSWTNTPGIARCLRIGFVSADLCAHPVGYFFEAAIAALASNTRGKLELFAYSTLTNSDEVTKRIQSHFHVWHDVLRYSDETLVQQIRQDSIDILIDLSGHTAHNRLPVFAWKPAPVQVSWLGYFATTGVGAIDYLIADHWTLPPDQEAYFTERIWRLEDTRLCFTVPDAQVLVSPLPAIDNGYVTFGCFNTLTKMNDSVVALWARILHALPTARLFLKSVQIAAPSLSQEISERFAAHGIDVDRLILEAYGPRADYLATYHRVDIALDPFPFPGGTTTVEALWMGVPVLTLAGERFLSRQGVGLLMNAGLPEWVASDPQDYVARAVSHAADLQRLASLRAGLRQQVLASPIFDAPRFAGHFAAALRGMWKIWCDKHAASTTAN